MALMQITVIPMGTGSASVGEYVASIEKMLRDRGIAHELGDMGTVVQGELKELLTIARDIHEHSFTKGVERVVTSILIDERRDVERGLGEKRKAVLERLK